MFGWLRKREYVIKANTLCRLRGHDWSQWSASVLSVPENVPPAERDLHAPEANRTCSRCYMVDSRGATEVESTTAITEYLEQADKEWADPETRRRLKGLGISGQNGNALHSPD